MPPRTPRTQAASTRGPHPGDTAALFIGLILLSGSIVSVLLLSLDHIGAIGLPGCGVGSACARAAKSPWATIPAIGLPVAFLGLGYSLFAAISWAGSGGRPGAAERWMVRVGSLGSVFYVVVSIMDHLLCPYCLATHACNILFWALAERARPGVLSGRRVIVAVLAAGLAMATLVGAKSRTSERARQHAERQLQASTRALTGPSKETGLTPAATAFEGRYRAGPAKAAVRIVVFADYQCPDCRRIEGEIGALARSNPRVAFSVKHFPLSTVCNPYTTEDVHPDACWAARAAESAGILGGGEAFWRMHEWLIQKEGAFTEADLSAAARAQGLDPQRLMSLLESPDVATRLRADMDEGMALGIQGCGTPMIFVNGVELKGWSAPDAIARTVAAVLTANPAEADATADQPPPAIDRFIGEWAAAPVAMFSPDVWRDAAGPTDGPVRVVVFGDLLEPSCREVDRTISEWAADPARGVRYAFRAFPLDQSCNPQLPRNAFPGACAVAGLREGTGLVGGASAAWKAHQWIAANADAARAAALAGTLPNELPALLGLDAATLTAGWTGAPVQSAVAGDIALARRLGLTKVPWIYVNERRVPEWKVMEQNILPRYLDAARAK